MTGRLNSVLAELKTLGAVFRPAPEAPAPNPSPPAATPAPVDPPIPEEPMTVIAGTGEVVIPVDEEVEAKIRALSGLPADSFSAVEDDEDVDEDEADDEDEPDDEPSGEEPDDDEMEEEAPKPPPQSFVATPAKNRIVTSATAARRLKEAFARLELLETCTADLRDALSAVAASIQEDT